MKPLTLCGFIPFLLFAFLSTSLQSVHIDYPCILITNDGELIGSLLILRIFVNLFWPVGTIFPEALVLLLADAYVFSCQHNNYMSVFVSVYLLLRFKREKKETIECWNKILCVIMEKSSKLSFFMSLLVYVELDENVLCHILSRDHWTWNENSWNVLSISQVCFI